MVNTVHNLMNCVRFMNHFKSTLCTSYRKVKGAYAETRLRAYCARKWDEPLSRAVGYQD